MADADSRFVVFHITQLRFSRHFRKRPSNSPDIQGTSKKREAETSSARLPFAWFSLFAGAERALLAASLVLRRDAALQGVQSFIRNSFNASAGGWASLT
jgi:hypothetical protein